ncbi:MAG: hypothetical protein AAF404_07350 [Pseudomonadota bacterium]
MLSRNHLLIITLMATSTLALAAFFHTGVDVSHIACTTINLWHSYRI